MKIFKLVLLYSFSIATLWAALPPEHLQLVEKFWKLDQAQQKALARVGAWSDKYKTSKVLSAASSQELESLMKEVHNLRMGARHLNRPAASVHVKLYRLLSFETLHDGDQIEYDEPRLLAIRLDDKDLFYLMMGTLADLLVYEQLSFLYHLTEGDRILIKRLDEIEIDGQVGHFSKMRDEWLATSKRREFGRALIMLDGHKGRLDQLIAQGHIFLTSLLTRMNTHIAKELRKSASFWGSFTDFFKSAYRKLKDAALNRLNWMEYQLSKIIGNTTGAVKWQKFMDSIPVEELGYIHGEVLRPGDIIVEKTQGALTDKFIPGFFGHLAMVLGTPEQLQGIKLANGSPLIDHPAIKAMLPRLSAGETIIEAIRSGAGLADIRKWEISDLAVIRASSYPEKYLGEVLLTAAQYAGRQYDFRFDVNTRVLPICSELPFHSFVGIRFRVEEYLGRWTISPDDVAVLVKDPSKEDLNRPLDLIYFYTNKRRLGASERFSTYRRVLELANSHYDEIPEQPSSELESMREAWEREWGLRAEIRNSVK